MRSIPITLGTVGQSSPQLSDFTTMNTRLAPRSLDLMLTIQNLNAEPVYYGTYLTWLTTLNAYLMSTMSPGSTTLNAFAGGAFDATGLYSNTGLNGLAAQCVSYGKEMTIRLAHEFNGDWNVYGNTQETAAQFIAGWQHIVTLFRNQGATNVKWCWCPNVWGLTGGGTHAVDPTTWYPGDAYVDFIALDGYMSNDATTTYMPHDLFYANYQTIRGLSSRPFGIAEVGCAEDGRLATTPGSPSGVTAGSKAGWYQLLFSMIQSGAVPCVFVTTYEQVIAGIGVTNRGDYTISSSGADPAAQSAFLAGATTYPFLANRSSVKALLPRTGA